MAVANGSLHQTHLDYLFKELDPNSLILSQFQTHHEPNLLQLATESFVMERGPRYKAYAELRESKLRMKNSRPQSQDHEPNLSPPKKQVKFQGNFSSTPPNRRKGSSVLAQSVPDFSSALRKENRRPRPALPPVAEKSLTPPLISKREKKYGGSRSVEKRSGGGGVLARKSYASMEELKGFSSAAANAINGENRGMRSGKSVLGYRQ